MKHSTIRADVSGSSIYLNQSPSLVVRGFVCLKKRVAKGRWFKRD